MNIFCVFQQFQETVSYIKAFMVTIITSFIGEHYKLARAVSFSLLPGGIYDFHLFVIIRLCLQGKTGKTN